MEFSNEYPSSKLFKMNLKQKNHQNVDFHLVFSIQMFTLQELFA
jgi:hypothetical protein